MTLPNVLENGSCTQRPTISALPVEITGKREGTGRIRIQSRGVWSKLITISGSVYGSNERRETQGRISNGR